MPTPGYTRGWSAALVEAARQFDAAGWRAQAGHLRALDREANIAAAYAAEPEPACRVGGTPPVPGIGWGVRVAGERSVYTISSVYLDDGDSLGGVGVVVRGGVRADEIAALYRPGDAADEPWWRRE